MATLVEPLAYESCHAMVCNACSAVAGIDPHTCILSTGCSAALQLSEDFMHTFDADELVDVLLSTSEATCCQ